MLLVTFKVDSQCYAIDARTVVEIIPMVKIRSLPGTPDYVRGVFNYRGILAPVVDLTRMLTGRNTAEYLSSRIILVNYSGNASGTNILGLLAEHVTDMAVREPGTMKDSGIDTSDGQWSGKISTVKEELIQVVEIGNLLTDELKGKLFTGAKENS